MLKKTASYINFIPLLLVVVGIAFIGLFALRNSPVYMMAMFTIASEPTKYSFDTYDKLLKNYVKDGLVDYKELSKSKLLDKALSELANTSDKKLSREGKVCYWINAYNLSVLKVISDKYPIKRLHEVGTDRASKKFIVGGKVYSTQQILAQKVDPAIFKFREAPEVVFLVCGGTLNYPPLTSHVITPKTLEVDAKVAAYKFITNKKNVYFDKDQGVFFLSSIFKRYERIFERVGHSPYSFVTLYLAPESTPDLTDIMLTKTYFSKVDYRINDTKLFKRRTAKKPQSYATKEKTGKKPAKAN